MRRLESHAAKGAAVPHHKQKRPAQRQTQVQIRCVSHNPAPGRGGHPWQHRYHQGERPDRAVSAGVIALGCTIGLPKMAWISHPISEAELENTINWYFSRDNLLAANDRALKLKIRLKSFTSLSISRLLVRPKYNNRMASGGKRKCNTCF
ncbi:MAG: Tn3 family transposase [Deltaproteobacteria bacterium]|nr:Tn3 family transposase [Deltaproteobacteria bacterium]